MNSSRSKTDLLESQELLETTELEFHGTQNATLSGSLTSISQNSQWSDPQLERTAALIASVPTLVLQELWTNEISAAMHRANKKKLLLRSRLKQGAVEKPQKGSLAQIASRREAEVSRQFPRMKVDELKHQIGFLVKKNALLTSLCKRLLGSPLVHEPNQWPMPKY